MSYPGSKSGNGVWQRIIGQMPPHSIYVEGFFGGGHVFHMKRSARSSVLIDRNPKVFSKLVQTPIVRPMLGKFCELIQTIYLPDDAVVYLDPPYPLSTRQERFYYDFEMTDEDHTSLLALLHGFKCRVLISGVQCPLYDKALASWRRVSYRTRWHTKTVTESLWCNFPEPELLHDWRYAGNNFRQRTSLKRLKARWLGKLNRMNPRQRGYVLAAIHEKFPAVSAGTGV
jgi:site-specific DNA-adenine methylase